jgi:hypothetical protein
MSENSGYDINYRNDAGFTPIMYALKHGHTDIAEHMWTQTLATIALNDEGDSDWLMEKKQNIRGYLDAAAANNWNGMRACFKKDRHVTKGRNHEAIRGICSRNESLAGTEVVAAALDAPCRASWRREGNVNFLRC